MKHFIFILCVSIFSLPAQAQDKYNYNWPLGYTPNIPNQYFGGSLIQFHKGQAEVSFFNIEIDFSGFHTAISDKDGNLVAYSNGCQIQNRAHTLMENGDGINPGIVHQQQCNEYSGYPSDQGGLFLPAPGSDSLFYLFHIRETSAGAVPRDLLYSVIDAKANNGLGKVVAKNVFLEHDSLVDEITAVRHANGRDWWLMVAENYRILAIPPGAKGKYHRYLIDPTGVHGPIEQLTGKLLSPKNYIGQSCFSPDGKKFVISTLYNGAHLFDFDRCSGLLSNFKHIQFDPDTLWFMGSAFSPNSRYLYLSTGKLILQYDLEAPDLEKAKKIVATYDGYAAPYPTTFFQLMLAPDKKIYISCPNGVYVMHIIHAPDEAGTACQVEQHGLQLPTYHAYTVPNLAWYNLYDEPGTVCDSLGINGPVAVAEPDDAPPPLFACFPNPAQNSLSLQFASPASGYVSITDAAGQTRARRDKPTGQIPMEFDVSFLPAGVYFVAFRPSSGQASTQKIVILR